jgi:putative Ca2+/H+ antiporter (TMEM165/GDT1 family)
MSAAAIAATVFAAVLLAEVVGDRSLYAIASLTARFGVRSVLIGVAPAYALKSLAAVLAANAVSHLPTAAVAAVSCVTWLVAAWAVWRREDGQARLDARARLSRPPLVAFASIAFTEWGDPGQLATALLAVRFHAPLLVWSSAAAALLTKSVVAAAVGLTARRYLELRWLRLAAAAFCVVSAAVSAAALFGA